MANLKQRVFMIFVRTYQTNTKDLIQKVDFNDLMWRDQTVPFTDPMKGATTMTNLSKIDPSSSIGKAMNMPTDAPAISDEFVPFNENQKFNSDIWWLHSMWTSFDEMKKNVRPIINAIGLNNVIIGGYIDLGLELLPNK